LACRWLSCEVGLSLDAACLESACLLLGENTLLDLAQESLLLLAC